MFSSSPLRAAFVIGAFAAALASACDATRPSPAESAGSSAATSVGGERCATPNEGCACDTPGRVVPCGTVKETSPGGYVSCSEGTRVCTGGTWGICNGTHVTTKTVGTIGFSALGAIQTCSSINPCDPYCSASVDNAVGLDGGTAFVANDAGLSLVAKSSGSACTSMSVSLSSTTITVSAINHTTGAVTSSPATVTATATLLPAGCAGSSPTITWAIDNLDRATIDAAGVVRNVSATSGPLAVTGYYASLSASASLTVKTVVTDAPAPTNRQAPPGQAAKYGDPIEAVSNVTWEYPYANTMFPLGLPAPTIQYTAGSHPGNSVKVTLRYPATGTAVFDWAMIVGETGSLQQEVYIPQTVWAAFERSAKNQTARIGLQRWAASKLQAVTTRDIKFANDNLAGRIFYTEYERSGTSAPRPNPGGACGSFGINAARTRTVDPTSTAAPADAIGGGGCPTCHTVSANGTMMVTADRGWGANGGVLRIGAGGTTTPIANAPQYPGTNADDDHRGFAWAALSPNGDYALQGSYYWGNVRWDGATGAANGSKPYVIWKLSSTPGVAPVQEATNWGLGNAYMLVPTFSPNGQKLAFVDGDATGGAAWRHGLSTFDVNISGKAFTNRKRVFSTPAAGAVIKWPAFEPDSASIVFVSSASNDMCTPGACDGKTGHGCGNMAPSNYNTGTGRLWSVDATAASPTAVELIKANVGERTDDQDKAYQPTVLPQSQGGYRWVVFTSTRPYGHLVNPVGTQPSCAAGQLWVTAVSDTTSGATDRSNPAFWLPTQNFSTDITDKNFTNERAYWVLDQCRPPGTSSASLCSSDDDCCAGSKCRIDLPVSSPPVRHCQTVSTCSGSGQSCTTSADCCSPGVCANAQCSLPAKYDPASYTRDYDVKCVTGERLAWRYFEWQSSTPTGSSIAFYAQTADTVAGLAAAPKVAIGTAAAPPVQTTGWKSSASTVSELLKAAGLTDRAYLRITMDFTPSTSPVDTPVLQAWRQLSTCVPAE